MISAKFLTSHKQHQHYINSRLSKYDIVAGLVEHCRYGRLPQCVCKQPHQNLASKGKRNKYKSVLL